MYSIIDSLPKTLLILFLYWLLIWIFDIDVHPLFDEIIFISLRLRASIDLFLRVGNLITSFINSKGIRYKGTLKSLTIEALFLKYLFSLFWSPVLWNFNTVVLVLRSFKWLTMKKRSLFSPFFRPKKLKKCCFFETIIRRVQWLWRRPNILLFRQFLFILLQRFPLFEAYINKIPGTNDESWLRLGHERNYLQPSASLWT